MKVTYDAIGTIYTPFEKEEGMPIQAVAAEGIAGYIELDEAYIPGLKDIEEFSHLILIYDFNLVQDFSLHVFPFLDQQPHGIFATRYPKRPNKIGISTVRLNKVDGNLLHVLDVDMLNKTPLLDVKPYVPYFDDRETNEIGWYKYRIGNTRNVKAYES